MSYEDTFLWSIYPDLSPPPKLNPGHQAELGLAYGSLPSLLAAWDRRIIGPKVLHFYAGFCAHRATCLEVDGKDITDLKLILNGDSNSNAENDADLVKS